MEENIKLAPRHVCELILNNLKQKNCLSLIRYGDGEAILLKNTDEQWVNKIFMNQLGYIPDKMNTHFLRQQLIYALDNTDVIGVPTERHLRIDFEYWRDSIEILKENCQVQNKSICSS